MINLANPAAPAAVAAYDTPGVALDVAVWSPTGGAGLCGRGRRRGRPHHLNVTTPASPLYVSQYDTPGEGLGVTVSASGAGTVLAPSWPT